MNEQEPKNKIGMKVYYDIQSGNVIVITPESSGVAIETTKEQDFNLYQALADKVPKTVGVVQLEHGAYIMDIVRGGFIERIDPGTLEPLFSYPSEADEEPPQSAVSFTSQIAELAADNERMQAENNELKHAVAELSLVLTEVMGGGG
ncbi:hypothetical protein [Paenibacillus sp. DCT19]|uniref:hypothetical protein n=1 Tax=Paenibacillus sp. DCT19 TaxID=2211212 RepID=UPI0020C2A048|nr:hypothetical protein [Paenibacillus sp. DCT19]